MATLVLEDREEKTRKEICACVKRLMQTAGTVLFRFEPAEKPCPPKGLAQQMETVDDSGSECSCISR